MTTNNSAEIATLALLIEMARADHDVDDREKEHVERLAEEHFDLNGIRLKQVVELAEQAADEAVSLFDFTRELDKTLKMNDKIRIVKILWRMAMADGHIDKHEEHLVRKVAELLHVPHSRFIQMKHHVLNDNQKVSSET